MRTTLTLEPDVFEGVKELAALRRTSFKEAVNTLLRRGLEQELPTDEEPFVVTPHRGGLAPGVDPTKLNQLLDDLYIDDAIAAMAGDA